MIIALLVLVCVFGVVLGNLKSNMREEYIRNIKEVISRVDTKK